ncbi:hypothetical protein WAI453_006903 [Rhynchosporium graminicola]|uniref:LysM domain-containing protein n=1 Tax=Rhynchosporium graminicola TaxID=2792576 RepID=A0A1E1KTN3_9HELO|nr:uncharacterized protein RCO7_02059 [Rhynchosporium commune]
MSSLMRQNYTIAAGDTLYEIAKRYGIDISVIQSLNPGVKPESLQVGQIIVVPGSAGSRLSSGYINADSSLAASTTYVIISGDTFYAIAKRLGTDVSHIQSLNPGVRPEALQVGQIVNVPSGPTQRPIVKQAQPAIEGYQYFSGPTHQFPHPNRWTPYEHLIKTNERLMLLNSSPTEVFYIKKWIPIVAYESGVDARVILSIIMQESGGNVRNPTTLSPAPDFVKNTGLMQAHNGQEWDERYPEWCVERMIRDGVQGTQYGDGLIQCFHKWDRNWYHACRAYNSGCVNREDLSDGITATGHYVERIANRLIGNQWAGM